jgi:hypothetical protein
MHFWLNREYIFRQAKTIGSLILRRLADAARLPERVFVVKQLTHPSRRASQ